ncbi:unnamed protein product [Didymodactylos carnosus]|uniref:J domain-containing protein n=1 Tax=Didymodactylos carnosus TaxID=1234261 RepID=A0A814WCR8_9BILA|nr:unnamed protein product [Didymodactylos carnosus]CAF1200478.1 unnamed protein product [Didymodactylos carnosus]CAF3888089.1 unnamed protein product [Didymodactylos carnosus]CAF3964990.1 unnamed protein product [Didymodactylos carnosus]
MSEMKLEYDEGGEMFLYFIVPVYAFILLPVTYWLWPKIEERKIVPHPTDTYDFAPYRNKYRLLHANEHNRKRQAILTKIGLVVACIFLLILIYRVSLIKIENGEYDPFAVLGVDQEAPIKKFKEIAEAYKTLTDEEARENWREYGNPDGRRVVRVGFAIPKWFVDRQNLSAQFYGVNRVTRSKSTAAGGPANIKRPQQLSL